MTRHHTHPCDRCHVESLCDGDLEANPDGWPEVVCIEFHTHNRSDFLCEDCAELQDRCDEIVGVPV